MSRQRVRHFNANDSIMDLIGEDFNILPVLSRFSIPLGFGYKTIAEVCSEHNIDERMFLLIVNFMFTGHIDIDSLGVEDVCSLIDYLHNSHEYYLGFKYPHIRANLINSLDEEHSDINPAIIRFFDEYVEQVSFHFRYEEETVFPYIRRLAEGNLNGEYNIEVFGKNHEEISDRLSELKNIILRFYTTSMPDKMYDALVDIFNVEEDLGLHTDIENQILIPLVTAVERRLRDA